MLHLLRSRKRQFAALRSAERLAVLGLGLSALGFFACSSDDSETPRAAAGNGTAAGASSSGGSSAGTNGNAGGSSSGANGNAGSAAAGEVIEGGIRDGAVPYFNQCGVAAPLPEDASCAVLDSPTIAHFDDFAGGNATDYTFALGTAPQATLAVQHVGDGSDTGGSVIATEMVPGVGGTGYALQFSNSNAANWGGLLMLYFPSGGCLDASAYSGVELSIKGVAPSKRFGVSVNMLDTIAASEGGTCDNETASDCKNATVELSLPAEPENWMRVRVPWGGLTPGVGSERSCVPVTGQNIVRIVVQPFMEYPPPDYMFAPGPYNLTIDDVRFYLDDSAPTTPLPDTGAECDLPPTIDWTASAPLISPVSDASHDLVAVKDSTVVYFEDRWHVYASSVSSTGAYSMIYTSFADFSEAPSAPIHYMDQTPGFEGYTAAPEVFYFTPQDKWYLVYQAGPPMFSTTSDIADPSSWTRPAPFFPTTPAIITKNGGGWLDFWVICDDASCYLFFSDNHGRWYRSKTAIQDFPGGFTEPEVVMMDANAGRLFEASNVYKMNGTDRYLALIESFDQTSDNRRYFRSWIADSLDGPWQPFHGSGSFPFAGPRNVTFDGTAWTEDISHGDMIRAGYDETLAIDPCNLRYLFQGADPLAETGGDYNKIPWQIGLLTQTP